MTTQELIDQYVTAHADNRWMDASELEALLTEFAEELKEPAIDNLEDALKAKVDEELKDPVFGKLINTFAAYAFAKQIVNWYKEQMMKDAIPFYQILKEVPTIERDSTMVIIIKE